MKAVFHLITAHLQVIRRTPVFHGTQHEERCRGSSIVMVPNSVLAMWGPTVFQSERQLQKRRRTAPESWLALSFGLCCPVLSALGDCRALQGQGKTLQRTLQSRRQLSGALAAAAAVRSAGTVIRQATQRAEHPSSVCSRAH